MIQLAIFILASTISLQSLAAVDADGYNEVTIRPSDYPRNAPKFQDFPVESYSGERSAPDLRSDKRSRKFRTRLGDAAKDKPNFAGHYVLANWGCGTNRTQFAIIDSKDGKVYHPPGLGFVDATNVHHDLLYAGSPLTTWHGEGSLQFRSDSELLVVIGTPENQTDERGISFYVWRDNKLKRIRFVKKAWYD